MTEEKDLMITVEMIGTGGMTGDQDMDDMMTACEEGAHIAVADRGVALEVETG